jgi:hypothetical protein
MYSGGKDSDVLLSLFAPSRCAIFSAGSWRPVPAALWTADAIFTVYYHSSSGTYRIANLPDRTGIIEAFAGATAPAATLLCYGQAISRRSARRTGPVTAARRSTRRTCQGA